MLSKLIILFFRWIKPRKAKFGKWTRLEGISAKIGEAVETEITKFPQLVVEYVSTALFIPSKILSNLFWVDLLQLYYLAMAINVPKQLPLLMSSKENKKDKKLGWDYEGRTENYYAFLLASSYGWTLQYIQGLDVDTALSHIQEILVNNQLDREFLWSMSEIAYPYNPSTKQSKFSPLTRPYFMAEVGREVRKIKIRKDMIPVGMVEDNTGMEKYFEKQEAEKVIPAGDSESV